MNKNHAGPNNDYLPLKSKSEILMKDIMGGWFFSIKMHIDPNKILLEFLTTWKLRGSLHNEADEERLNEYGRTIVYTICLTGNLSSCLIKFEKNKYRALINTTAEVSLIDRKMCTTV